MDIQSLEARFEHISVNDENQEQALTHSKSKVRMIQIETQCKVN